MPRAQSGGLSTVSPLQARSLKGQSDILASGELVGLWRSQNLEHWMRPYSFGGCIAGSILICCPHAGLSCSLTFTASESRHCGSCCNRRKRRYVWNTPDLKSICSSPRISPSFIACGWGRSLSPRPPMRAPSRSKVHPLWFERFRDGCNLATSPILCVRHSPANHLRCANRLSLYLATDSYHR